MEFIAPKHLSSYIKVIGVGGGGVNAVNHMFRQGIVGVDFFVCDNDCHHIEQSPVPTKIHLEPESSHPTPLEVHDSVVQNAGTIKDYLSENTKMLFIMAGMGSTTGTVAAPVIAHIAKEIETGDEYIPEILVVAVVTMPFRFEGKARIDKALEGLEALRSKVDSIIVIENNKLLEGEKLTFSQCFAKADEMMSSAVNCLITPLASDSLINVDFRDLAMVLNGGGDTFMGIGVAQGETRSLDAMLQALQKPLTTISDMSGARTVFLHFSFSKEHELTNDELVQAFNYFNGVCVRQPIVRYGMGYDETLGESVKVVVVATVIQPIDMGPDTRTAGVPLFPFF